MRVLMSLVLLTVVLAPGAAFAVWGQSWGTMAWGAAALVPTLGLPGVVALAALLLLASFSLRRRSRGLARAMLAVGVLVIPAAVIAGPVSIPNLFVNGTVADADDVNQNFSEVAGAINDNDGRIGQIETDRASAFTVQDLFVGGNADFGNNVLIQSDLNVVGTLTKSAGMFQIDHPVDPANKMLLHSFVESDEYKNVYDGVVVLDAEGATAVDLPGWFEALNRDFRYQLTPIGAPAPGLYVAREVADGRFEIAGGDPGLKISWQVTGVRQDRYAADHPLDVEQDKPLDARGTFLYPEGYEDLTAAGR